MTTWITATANFILIFLLALYVTAAYASMWTRRWEAGFTRCMSLCRYFLHGYGFFVLFLTSQDYRQVPFYLLQLAFFILADILQKRIYEKSIPMLYQNMMLLLSVGLLVLGRLAFDSAVKQFLMAVLSFAICMMIPWVFRRLPNLERLGALYIFAGIGLLAVVLFLGSEVFGAKNWLTIKGITFQPSEFVKLTFVLSMAALLVKKIKSKYRGLLLVSVVAALHVGFLALANDFGGALIFFTVYVLMLFVISADILFPTAAVLSGCFAAVLAYRYSGHIEERVLAWKNPFSCIEKEGYQMAQSLFAIGSGEWFGTGFFQGMPQTVPVVKSDFIFAAISEELGAIFAALLLCVYINCIIWMLTLALERKQPFFSAVTTGAVALFGVQLFLNVGGVIKLIPSTGVTLAFISYGGSSLLGTMVLFQGMQGMRCLEVPQEEKKRGKKKKESQASQTGQQVRMILVCALLLLGLCSTTAYFLGITVKTAKNDYYNDYNKRIKEQEKTMPKGKILAADGTILAHSILGADGRMYRLYPHGAKTVYLTGQMLMGRSGMEESYREELYTVGLDFFEKIRRKAAGEVPEGNSIVTTIDWKLQNAICEAMDGYSGAMGVMEVKTGKLLAYVSTPSYDPNEISVQWEELTARTDAPFLNRFTKGLYPPGSTFKIVTTLAYLREHTPEEFSYHCTGTARFKNTTVHCYASKAHGSQTLKGAFANSCNTAYAYMGEQVSTETYQAVAAELGFNSAWDGTIDYLADSFPMSEESSDAAKVQATFGQGETLVTPFHMLMITSAIANDGALKLPYVVEKLQNCDGELLTWYGSSGEHILMNEDEAALLTEYMVEASSGKFPSLEEQGITVAGKTGSADFAVGEAAHAWYVCFAPAKEPEIALVVLMENVGTGGKYALPAARKVLEAYFLEGQE